MKDGVVLDLRYEARDIDQRITSQTKIDQWFEAKTRGLQRWYRQRLRELVPPLVARWESKLGVRVAAWGIKAMKTKWGTCNPRAGRIWLNLELAKKPPECLEYLVVHELVHLLVRHHDDRFHALMDRHFPRWRQVRRELNAVPLAHARWSC